MIWVFRFLIVFGWGFLFFGTNWHHTDPDYIRLEIATRTWVTIIFAGGSIGFMELGRAIRKYEDKEE